MSKRRNYKSKRRNYKAKKINRKSRQRGGFINPLAAISTFVDVITSKPNKESIPIPNKSPIIDLTGGYASPLRQIQGKLSELKNKNSF